jgi:hypothetical protein
MNYAKGLMWKHLNPSESYEPLRQIAASNRGIKLKGVSVSDSNRVSSLLPCVRAAELVDYTVHFDGGLCEHEHILTDVHSTENVGGAHSADNVAAASRSRGLGWSYASVRKFRVSTSPRTASLAVRLLKHELLGMMHAFERSLTDLRTAREDACVPAMRGEFR